MRQIALILCAVAALFAAIAASTAAGSEAEYNSALAAAESANKEAGALKNQWTTTAQKLAAGGRMQS